MKRRVTVPTMHGEVDYVTVECAHCETDMMEADAVQVVVGGRAREAYSSQVRVRGESDVLALCPYCAEALFGYVEEPRGVKPEVLRQLDRVPDIDLFGFLFWLIIVATGGMFLLLFAAILVGA